MKLRNHKNFIRIEKGFAQFQSRLNVCDIIFKFFCAHAKHNGTS